MSKTKRLSDIEIKAKLRSGTLRFVPTPNLRRRVLDIARIDELDVTTRKSTQGGYYVIYLNGGAK